MYRSVREAPARRQAAVARRRVLSASEEYCQEITRREARNFYWGFLALPRRQRIAIYALYSFSRQVDDAVDVSSSRPNGSRSGRPANGGIIVPDASSAVGAPTRKPRLNPEEACRVQRRRIDECYEGKPSDPVMRVLAEVVRDYAIPRSELRALVDGVEMDLLNFRYRDWPALEEYARHVASAVGRMCTRIFGFSDPVALEHADDLGIALQITNILRDVREDFDLGRIYLPQEDLERFGVPENHLDRVDPAGRWKDLVEFESQRAESYLDSGLRVVEYIPRRAAVCVRTMSGMYTNILKQIADDPYLPLRQRARLRKRTKLKVMLQSWLRPV